MTKRKIAGLAKRWNNRALEQQSDGAVERRGGRFSAEGTEVNAAVQRRENQQHRDRNSRPLHRASP